MFRNKKYIININKNIYIKYKNYSNNFYKLEFYSKLGKIYYIFSKKIKIKYFKKNKFLILTFLKIKYKYLLKLYYNIIQNLIYSVLGGYLLKFYLKGRGFSIKLSKNYYWLESKLGFSHIIRIYLPKTIIIKKLDKNNFFLFSLYYEDLKSFSKILQNYKYPDIYRNKGILFEKEKLKIKEGKKKY